MLQAVISHRSTGVNENRRDLQVPTTNKVILLINRAAQIQSATVTALPGLIQ